ncbi:hypothetical protein C0J52_12990 [Blattella germanica]|nr:hypothetical protein C0J52_12990 [Blattella germanica]
MNTERLNQTHSRQGAASQMSETQSSDLPRIREVCSTAVIALSNTTSSGEDQEHGRAMQLLNYMYSYFIPTVYFLPNYVLQVLCNNMDTIVDSILKVTRTAILAAGYAKVQIPDILKGFSTLYGYIWGDVRIVGGYFANLATIYRRSHIIVEPKENGDYYAEGAFGLNILELGFSEYLCKLMGIGPSGSFYTNVGENTVKIAFTLVSGKSMWNPYIEEISFQRFDKVTYKITGFWFLNVVIEKFLEFLTPKIFGAFVKTLEDGVVTALREVIEEQNKDTSDLQAIELEPDLQI